MFSTQQLAVASFEGLFHKLSLTPDCCIIPYFLEDIIHCKVIAILCITKEEKKTANYL